MTESFGIVLFVLLLICSQFSLFIMSVLATLRVRFMSCQVSFQIPLLGEFSLTVWTLKWFHPIVTERVSLQTVQCEETLRALRA